MEEGVDIATELYVGVVVDRGTQRVTMMASSEGGMEIEQVAAETPEKIHKLSIDPVSGLDKSEARELADQIGLEGTPGKKAGEFFGHCTRHSGILTLRLRRSTR